MSLQHSAITESHALNFTPLAALVCALLLAVTPLAQADTGAGGAPSVYRVGARQIALPVPELFRDPSVSAPALSAMGKTLTPPFARFLAIYVPPAAVAHAKAGNEAAMERYYLVQSNRRFEAMTFSKSGFAQLKTQMRTQQAELIKLAAMPALKEGMRDMSRKLAEMAKDRTMSMKVGDIHPLGVLDESDDMISFGSVMKLDVIKEGKPSQLVLANSTTLVRLKDKVIALYAYSDYRNDDDLAWVRSAGRTWSVSATLLNKD